MVISIPIQVSLVNLKKTKNNFYTTMAISPAPKRKNESTKEPEYSEKKVREVINRGGQPLPIRSDNTSSTIFKSINIKLTEDEIEIIKKLRNKRNAPRGKKVPISLHNWIIEAIEDKLVKEKKKYKF